MPGQFGGRSPKGGPNPAREEFVIRGPFPGANYKDDSYLVGDHREAQESVNVDNLFGAIQPRAGVERLVKFQEIDGSALSPTNLRAIVNRIPSNVNKGLLFLDTRDSAPPTMLVGGSYVPYTNTDSMQDIVAIGRWFQRDALDQARFANPPETSGYNGWGPQRYKVANFGGLASFTYGSTTVTIGPDAASIEPDPVLLATVVGSYIRSCALGTPTELNFTNKVLLVTYNAGTGVYTLTLDTAWVASGAANLPNVNYAFAMPIRDDSIRTRFGGSLVPKVDYCDVPDSVSSITKAIILAEPQVYGSAGVDGYIYINRDPTVTVPIGGADPAGTSQYQSGMYQLGSAGSAEFSRIIVPVDAFSGSNPITASPGSGRDLVEGMLIKSPSDIHDYTHTITKVYPEVWAWTKNGAGNRTYFRAVEALVWPPFKTGEYGPDGGGAYSVLLIEKKPQLAVTGAYGSTMCSPGAAPLPLQVLDDPDTDVTYLANACFYFGDRLILLTDQSVEPLQGYTNDGTTGVVTPYTAYGPNGTVRYHPGSVACSKNGDPRRFQGLSSAFYQLDIGPLIDGFVLRETAYLIGLRGIIAMTRTGQLENPFDFQKLDLTKEFVPWLKPVVIDANQAILFATDDVYLFDGANARPVTGNLANVWRQFCLVNGPEAIAGHTFYDQKRSRVHISKGTAASGASGFGNTEFVFDTDTGSWFQNKSFDYLGGFAEWTTVLDDFARFPIKHECLIHTVGRTADSTSTTVYDWIGAYNWDLVADEADFESPKGTAQIVWKWVGNWEQMESARWYKEASRVRITHRPNPITGDASLRNMWVRVQMDDGRLVEGKVNMTNQQAVAGSWPLERNVFFTGTVSSPLVLTGFAFRVEISNPGVALGTGEVTFRPIIHEIALTYLDRQEVEQL